MCDALFEEDFMVWVSSNYPTQESAKLKCAEATTRMKEQFPRLRRVRGEVMVCTQMRPHWWCVTDGGEIVDPTAHQWDTPVVFYKEIADDAEEPVGKCIYCGSLLYRSKGANSYLCENCTP
jgi:hypothetical protein